MVGPKISLMRMTSLTVFGKAVRRLADTYRNHFRPARLAPIVKPVADHFRRGSIMAQHVIEMPVVEGHLDEIVKRGQFVEVANETGRIKPVRLQPNFDVIIVPMQ